MFVNLDCQPNLRDLLLTGIHTSSFDLAYAETLPGYRLRKLFIALKYGPLETDDGITALLGTAAATLEAVSIVEHKLQLLEEVDEYLVFSTDFVNALTQCLKLLHFESVGSHFFKREDWQFLCARSLPHFDQVHVEAQHLKLYDRPDHLDLLCREYERAGFGAHVLAPAGSSPSTPPPIPNLRWLPHTE
jgi:hypothetical protein